MNTTNRLEKLNSLLSRELAVLIKNQDYNDRLITILEVKTASDLSEARVLLGIIYFKNPIDNIKQKKDRELINKLTNKSYKIRKSLRKRLHLKKIPKFIFKINKQADQIQKIDNLLDSIKKNNATWIVLSSFIW